MTDFDTRYYAYQAEQDAHLTPDALRPVFAKAARYYRLLLGAHLPSPTGDRSLLDVACGRGNFLYFLREMGFAHAVGVDTNERRIALAQGLGLDARNEDAFAWLERHEAAYDVISGLDFLEHLPKEPALHFLTIAHRSLKPGGRLILRTPSADGPFGASSRYNDFTHHQAFTSGLLRELIKMSGFVDPVVFGETPQPYNLVNTVRSGLFRVAQPVASVALAALGLGRPAIWSRDMWAVGHKPE
jgi:2-polyprenyl-3-methyl-5-hydroxy-6-metoxy-1,4-benzoquinol methylase